MFMLETRREAVPNDSPDAQTQSLLYLLLYLLSLPIFGILYGHWPPTMDFSLVLTLLLRHGPQIAWSITPIVAASVTY
jgi:hypothetical protein